MAWGLIISFAVGVLCALRVPILHFTIIVLIVMVGYSLANIGSANSTLDNIGWSFVLAAVLEAGYIFPHVLLYLVYVKILGRDLNRSPKQRSGLSAYNLFRVHSNDRLSAKAEGTGPDKARRGMQD
ncbi:hypothetical protein [Rhizobium sp. P44RR-XXIV]|uniref:hypothetical protein n=1 Tax=Rhizobium sp. P44RR-XXIV TaxID=1921145 RepID=UPI0009853D15|nr:hypothetical protein [Rhizobium sp. P44RR-XXIV]TIX90888.1 hypothetical protein BSK43_016840 [Rhizobium sp. P44RR-XXIV]